MDRSLNLALRSLLITSAMLMAAVALAASPGFSLAAAGAADAAGWLSPLLSFSEDLGIGSIRDGVIKAELADPMSPVSSVLAWILAGLCLAGALMMRRFPGR